MKFYELYNDLVVELVDNFLLTREQAEALVDEKETLLIDLVEFGDETNVYNLADIITDNDF